MDIGKAIGDSISASMCSSISQFTQDMIAALKDPPPGMGGQDQQSPADKGDKQEDVPAFQAEVIQPGPSSEMPDEKRPSDGCASKNVGKAKDSSATRGKKRESPTLGSELANKKRKVTDVEPQQGIAHVDSDVSEADEDGSDTDSVNESDELAPTQETDSFVELVF